MPKLGVNIDHVATLRQARRGKEPDPIYAALLCEKAGANSIVAHLREDRRHINDRDIRILKQAVKTRLNLEMSINKEIVGIACNIKPGQATLVPEKRLELTTEGGLDLNANKKSVREAIKKLKSKGIVINLFIDPNHKQIEIARELESEFIELHTGRYADCISEAQSKKHLNNLIDSTQYAISLGLRVNAGHGLNYQNVRPVAKIEGIEELNIGHSIISRAVYAGLTQAVKEMVALING